MPRRLLAVGLVGCIGCTSGPPLPVASGPDPHQVWMAVDSAGATARVVQSDTAKASIAAIGQANRTTSAGSLAAAADMPDLIEQVDFAAAGERASARPSHPVVVPPAGDLKALIADGSTAHRDPSPRQNESAVVTSSDVSPVETFRRPREVQEDSPDSSFVLTAEPAGESPQPEQPSVEDLLPPDAVPMNLPTVLAAVGGQHPVVGMARWRVREAYAELKRARVMWLPSIRSGMHYHRHDGNYQASNGDIVDVNRNSFLYGLGVGATGAGTMQQPGIVAEFHFADAIFQPKIAERTASARGHAAGAALNEQLLEAAVAYTELLGAHQDVAVVAASRDRTAELAKLTDDFAEAGQGLRADADRLRTELALVNNRLLGAQQTAAVAAAQLAEAISYNGYDSIVPMDVVLVPLDLVSAEMERGALIGTGLAMRPELKESQALVAAACEAYRREKIAPFVPSVLLGFSTGGFGGGLGSELDDVETRYDFDAVMAWQVRNLGFGEQAARSEQSARVQQAKFERIRVMDRIAREIAEGHAGVLYRRQQIETTREAIRAAEQSHQRNLKRIRDGEGLPLEVLQSVQALETAHRAHLQAIVDYNRAQFHLQWAQGWPVQPPQSE